jgi:CRISPR-associated protein Cmr4
MHYLTYSYLLTPLHTGASSQAGNMMGIAREVHTELPYLPSSSLRGKIRAVMEATYADETAENETSLAETLFGERLQDGKQPTEGEVWFADATLLLFPIASYSHQYVWITCPLWLSRWNRWLANPDLGELIESWQEVLSKPPAAQGKSAITSVSGKQIYLQGARLGENDLMAIDPKAACWESFKQIPDGNGVLELKHKLMILSNEDCAGLVETGLQREVRVALNEHEKTVKGGSFRSEEAIPSETVLFFPWGFKPMKSAEKTHEVRTALQDTLNDKLQFGGLEGLGRGWTENTTIEINHQ